MDVASIFLGWLLGMLSPVIVSRIYRHYKKSDLYSGISKEINHTKERLILTLDSISHRTGSYNRELIEWLLESYEKIEFPNPSVSKFYRMQLECGDKELQAMIRYQAKPDGIGLSLQKFPLLFLGLHISDVSLFSSELQVEIFELKNRIEMLNSEIELAGKYFFMTFDSSISADNQEIIAIDLVNKYRHIEDMIKRAVEQINKINNIKKI